MIFYVPKNKQKKVRKKLYKLEEVKFNFSDVGSSVNFSNE